MLETRVLGGEAGRRGFFGGQANRSRTIGLAVVAIVGGLATMYLQVFGLVPTAVAAAVVYVATIRTHGAGSMWSRWQDRRRWRERRRLGVIDFVPAQWSDEAARLIADDAPAEARREWPDGADGMRWLQRGRGLPGVCWHTPRGEQPYLSVAFSVQGQVRGVESDETVNAAMTAWGSFLARFGSPHALPSTIQVLTRVVPVDSAWHEAWIADNLATDADPDLVDSYDELVRKTASRGLMQRHYVVVRWPLTSAFAVAAARRGPGQLGWLALMEAEIGAVTSHLRMARMGAVQALSAAQVAAVLRHMQIPTWPIDQVADVDIDVPWFAARDEVATTVSRGPGPDGGVEEWWHRTAVIPIEAVETGLRTSLWLAPVLSQMTYPVVRTISLQIEVTPQSEARAGARSDVTTDLADLAAQREKGLLTDADLQAGATAAQRRLDDLRPGSGHHGAGWVGHITISSPSRVGLVDATARITEAATNAGIAWLDWLDTQQAAASSCTWPLARGARPLGASGASTRLRRMATSSGTKEGI